MESNPAHSTRPGPRAALAAIAAITVSLAAGAQTPLGSLDLRVHDSDLSPAITVREAENRTLEEYRVNGNLYMVKVTPTVGAPYYLVDQDGSGDMNLHRGGSDTNIQIPQWALLSW
jgi:hypothetical protein